MLYKITHNGNKRVYADVLLADNSIYKVGSSLVVILSIDCRYKSGWVYRFRKADPQEKKNFKEI